MTEQLMAEAPGVPALVDAVDDLYRRLVSAASRN